MFTDNRPTEPPEFDAPILCDLCKQDVESDRGCRCPECPKCGEAGHAECDANKWTQFTKRTNDPKLGWIERCLADVGIPSRRHGASWHAPILQVPAWAEERADTFLRTIDDIEDDHEMFYELP